MRMVGGGVGGGGGGGLSPLPNTSSVLNGQKNGSMEKIQLVVGQMLC